MNIDWSKAPDGTEAASPETAGTYAAWYRRDVAGLVEQICPGAHVNNWTWMGGRKDFPIGHVLRPDPPILVQHWTGEGQPPDGTLCEWKEKTGFQWVQATVLFITEQSVVLQRSDGFEWQMLTKAVVFRPIRTPEQIAAEAKLEAAKELYCTINCFEGAQQWDRLSLSRKGDYLKAIEAGWGKVLRA